MIRLIMIDSMITRKTCFFSRDTEVTFLNFIKQVYKLVVYKRELNKHFVSQSTHCGFGLGMKYDYVLKMEEINEWFDCFIDKVNIRELMMHGWPEENDCYLSTNKTPCHGPYYNQEGVLIKPEGAVSLHQTKSQTMVEQYYDQSLVKRLVAYIYQEDIFNFDYPVLK
eukprot:TRINITY_DN2068_c0_g1_i1.p4 TRINITY_DN2068_c0_g1~~TRINITY_DN2068_c0_g1_i1.p4  ORF type:complete len:167 (-),score=11.29 TRINITY_DN2068_c0_g1_i1:648-1148(-)